jgi:dihydrofolate reductase
MGGAMHLIVACDLNGGIGYQGRIPWHIPEDLRRFKTLTTTLTATDDAATLSQSPADMNKQNAVIMGRKTFESLPFSNGLPGRINIVVTRNMSYAVHAPNVVICHSMHVALQYASTHPQINDVYVIGGQQIYKEMLDHYADLLENVYITMIHDVYSPCDAFFPLQQVVNNPLFSQTYISELQYSQSGGYIFTYHTLENLKVKHKNLLT